MESLQFINRLNTHCDKWDGLFDLYGNADLIALWVADMDIRCPKAVEEALSARVAHNVYGYAKLPESYFDAVVAWQQERHQNAIQKEWLVSMPGVVPGLRWSIQRFTDPSDACLILTPLYPPFASSVRESGRTLIESKLQNNNGHFTIDFAEVERLIVAHNVKMWLFCSPHNPVGRVWTKDELSQVVALCEKYDLYLVSDEIHQDLVLSGHQHIPMRLVAPSEKLISLTAASKTFNLAGLHHSFAIIEDPTLRAAFQEYRAYLGIEDGSILRYLATEAAYTHGKDWLTSLLSFVEKQYNSLKTQLEAALPDVVVTPLQGTYLAYVDFGAYLTADRLRPVMQERCKLAPSYGEAFSGDPADTHLRLNLATDPATLQLAIDRLIAALAR